MCCTRLAENTGRKKSPKIAIWPPSHNFVGLYLRNPATFNRFRVLAALLHGSQVVSVGQTLRRWTEGATYVRAGRPSSWALAHISSCIVFSFFSTVPRDGKIISKMTSLCRVGHKTLTQSISWFCVTLAPYLGLCHFVCFPCCRGDVSVVQPLPVVDSSRVNSTWCHCHQPAFDWLSSQSPCGLELI